MQNNIGYRSGIYRSGGDAGNSNHICLSQKRIIKWQFLFFNISQFVNDYQIGILCKFMLNRD